MIILLKLFRQKYNLYRAAWMLLYERGYLFDKPVFSNIWDRANRIIPAIENRRQYLELLIFNFLHPGQFIRIDLARCPLRNIDVFVVVNTYIMWVYKDLFSLGHGL